MLCLSKYFFKFFLILGFIELIKSFIISKIYTIFSLSFDSSSEINKPDFNIL